MTKALNSKRIEVSRCVPDQGQEDPGRGQDVGHDPQHTDPGDDPTQHRARQTEYVPDVAARTAKVLPARVADVFCLADPAPAWEPCVIMCATLRALTDDAVMTLSRSAPDRPGSSRVPDLRSQLGPSADSWGLP